MKTFEDSLKSVRGLSSPALDDALRFGMRNERFFCAMNNIKERNKIFMTITQKAKNVHKYKHWIEEVAKHNVFKIDDYLLLNSEERPQVKVTLKKRRAGFGHCLVCVEFYWKIVYGIRTFAFGSSKEFEFASCCRDLRSIAEMMNNFHHERLRTAWRMIYG